MLNHDPINLLKQFEIPYKDNSAEWVTIACPYHGDDDKDLDKAKGGIHKRSGAFKCFKCSAPGNIISIIAVRMNVPVDAVIAHADNVLGTASTKYDPALVDLCRKELACNTEQLTNLNCRHGISPESVEKYHLGYHAQMQRISIPVYNERGEINSIKWYKYNPAGTEAKMIQPKGFRHSLYLYNEVKNEERIFITEGEFKAIILNQNGFPACCSTGGAGTFKQEWAQLFKDKEIIIVYDVDKAGMSGARKLCLILFPYVKRIKNIILFDVQDISDGDISDYFVKKCRTKEDFAALVENTPWFEPAKHSATVEEEYNDPIELPLARTSLAEFNGKIVQTTAVVSAKDTAPYIIPKTVTVCCGRDKEYCIYCPIYSGDEVKPITIKSDSAVILEMVGRDEASQWKVLKERAGIYPKCNSFAFKNVESHNVEEIRLIPQIAIGSSTEEQCTRKAYYVGHGIGANATYTMKARVAAEPSDSHATLVIFESEPVEDDINNFKTEQNLAIFQPKEWTATAICEKLADLYGDLAINVTRIYKREDLHLFYDLIWHTALRFNFQGRDIKGWGDALVIGDSGQGKSECSSRLLQHYRCGERVDTKRASIAGIVGGLQETGKRWFVTWGTVPLQDRRLVILEEVKGMPAPELAKMTDMRSSGIAEIIKIERAKTHARTRLIWISNPRSDNKMSGYNYGVDAVKELIGTLEDIRRFDMVISVASGEVPIEIVNARNDFVKEHVYTSDLCSSLVGFAWSRRESDISIGRETEDAILACSARMGATYSSACPIVEPSDQRLKIARLSVALAIRTYSVDESGKVIVRPCHVEVVEQFLNRIYASKSLGYLDFSKAQKGEDSISNPEEIEAKLSEMPNARDSVKGMIEAELIRTEDICNYTEWDDDCANVLIGFLTRNNCIKRSRRGGYRKTSAFIELLKKLDRSNLSSQTYREILQKGNL